MLKRTFVLIFGLILAMSGIANAEVDFFQPLVQQAFAHSDTVAIFGAI